MNDKAATLSGLGIAFCATLPYLHGRLLITVSVLVTVLFIFSIVLWQHARFSNPVWKWFVEMAENTEVIYPAWGFGTAGAGVALLDNHSLWPLGCVLLLIGVIVLGLGVGRGIGLFAKTVVNRRS
jgi:hypothetical protein